MPDKHRLKDGRKLVLKVERNLSRKEIDSLRLLLSHKGDYLQHLEDYWRHGSKGKIEGLEWRFYLAFVDDKLVANLCLWESSGVAILGHVYTHPDFRRLGIAGALFDFQDKDFFGRGGKVVQLRTDAGSHAYRMYQQRGYEDIPGGEGMMIKLLNPEAWEDLYRFTTTRAAPFHWRHWPTANLLFLLNTPAFVRCVGYGVYGVESLESSVATRFPAQRADLERGWDQIEVLETESGVCAAWASVMRNSNWRGHSKERVFDLHFHPEAAKGLDRLIRRFSLTPGTRAYSTPHDPKNPYLEKMGFQKVETRDRLFENGESLVVFER